MGYQDLEKSCLTFPSTHSFPRDFDFDGFGWETQVMIASDWRFTVLPGKSSKLRGLLATFQGWMFCFQDEIIIPGLS